MFTTMRQRGLCLITFQVDIFYNRLVPCGIRTAASDFRPRPRSPVILLRHGERSVVVNAERKASPRISKRAQEVIDLALSLNKARHMDEILLGLVETVTEVCEAEAATIYAIDTRTRELYSKAKVEKDIHEIRLSIDTESVAGYAAATGQTVNLKNAYDPAELKKYPGLKFNDAWDRLSGFKTRSVLCIPLRYQDTGPQGAIQLINSRTNERFTRADERLITMIARAVAVAFFNQGRIRKEPTRFDLLLDRGIITADDVEKAEAKAHYYRDDPVDGDPLTWLIRDFGVSKVMMGKSLSQFHQTPVFEFREGTDVIYRLIEELNISHKYLSNNMWVPVKKEGDEVTVVTDDPKDVGKVTDIINDIHRQGFARQVKFWVGFREDIRKFLDPDLIPDQTLLTDRKEEYEEDETSLEFNENAPTIVKLVNDFIRQALHSRISDIHLEPYPGRQPTTIRFRLDGVCYKHSEIRPQHAKAVINRLKIMANLKVDERRMPQSGKIKLRYQEKDVELRVEVTPTVGGQEDIVMRILTSSKPLELGEMNFSETNHRFLKDIIAKPYGIILCVGPTGSGKTTTLHSVLSYLNTPDKKIWTAEDPVEITQRGLRQVQINPHIRPNPFDFAAAMRSFLRADPDIIMVGEMRDRETAGIAIEASLTGHLVLSTLHTNSASETVTRIVEMGLDPLNVSDAVLGILAQRLVRTLCDNCKAGYIAPAEEIRELRDAYGPDYAPELRLDQEDKHVLHRAVGCAQCNDIGYRGRTAIHELLPGTPAIKKLIRERASAVVIRDQGLREGMRTLKMDGIQKVMQGQTDLGQVLKVCID